MPWDKKIENNKICVYKKTSGKTMHCYPNTPAGEEEANKYLAALHIHASEKELKEILGGNGSELLAYKEPDAALYECESCGENAVYGAALLLEMVC